MIQQYKVDKVNELSQRLDGAKSIILVDYKGINIEEVNELRNRLRKVGVDYFVAKNTFIKRALNDLNIDALNTYLQGPTAVAVSKEDEVASARELKKFKKEVMEDKAFPECKAGFVSGMLYTAEQVEMLAQLPSREELIAKILGSMNAPISNFVGVTSGILRKVVYAVDAVRKQKEQN